MRVGWLKAETSTGSLKTDASLPVYAPRPSRLTALLRRLAIVIASVLLLVYLLSYVADCLTAYAFVGLKWESAQKRAQLALSRCIASGNLSSFSDFEREIAVMQSLARATAEGTKRPRDPKAMREALLKADVPPRDVDALIRFSGLLPKSSFVRINQEVALRARIRVQRQTGIGYEIRQELLSTHPNWEKLRDLQNELEKIDVAANLDAVDFLRRIRSRIRDATILLLLTVAAGTLALFWVSFIELRSLVRRLAATEADLRERDEQLHQARKLDALGRFAGGIAHDFNNLLMVISASSELAQGHISTANPGRRFLSEILRATRQGTLLTQQLLVFGRKQVLEKRIFELDSLMEENSLLLRRLIGEHIELRWKLGSSGSTIEVDSSQFTQMLLNLAANARDAMPEGGVLSISTRIASPEETANAPRSVRGHVAIEVSDQGNGMSTETQTRLFEPFFTTKEAGKGVGLGLAMVYGIVKQSQGLITVESALHQGSTFRIYFPRSAQAAIPLKPRTELKPKIVSAETVLLVEDQAALRQIMTTALESDGYRVVAAKDGEEALDLARRYIGPIHLLLTDVVMPKMSGRELAKRVRDFLPEVLVVYISGHAPSEHFENGVIEAGAGFLQKPCSLASISLKIRQMLDRAKREKTNTA